MDTILLLTLVAALALIGVAVFYCVRVYHRERRHRRRRAESWTPDGPGQT